MVKQRLDKVFFNSEIGVVGMREVFANGQSAMLRSTVVHNESKPPGAVEQHANIPSMAVYTGSEF